MKQDNAQYEQIAREAKVLGYIKIIDLVGIIVAEESYIDILPKLNDEYLPRGLMRPVKQTESIEYWQTKENRIWAWMSLFRRWAGIEPDVIKERSRGIRFLDCYGLNKKSGEFNKVDLNQNIPDYFDDYIKLDDFKDYLKNIESLNQIQLPVPLILCSDEIRKQKIFSCKPSTKWEDVKITLVDDDVVKIETPQGGGRFSYHELGLSDRRSANKPKILWFLFKLFAQNNGCVSSTNIKYDPKLPDTAKRLNKHLQTTFDIHESIFIDHYKTKKGYKTKIFFSDQTVVT